MVLPLLSFAHQDTIYHTPDTTSGEEYKYYVDLTRQPDAVKAVWLGAIFPGAGQMYNRSYWKLPIVYGAFMGCGYAVGWTNNRCTNYKNAYIDLYAILATVVVYALTLIDAYVDAQLFDYDISPDLSLNVEPQIYYDLQHRHSAELKFAIQF